MKKEQGGKNEKMNVTSHNYSVMNTEKISQYTGEPREHDNIIKDLLTNARFTGFLLTRIIPEMKGVTLDQFCAYTNTDSDTGGDLKQQATEISSAGMKDVRLDLVFEYDAASKLLLRVNEEPQTSQESYSETNMESYSLVARAAYYASLAMVTGIRSREEYHQIRKVYSVWICFKRPIPEVREPILSYSLKPDEAYQYVDGTPLNKNKRKFDNGDLIGIVMISIPDLENFVANEKSTKKYSLEILTDLYNLLSNNVSYEERKNFYYDTAIVKEGFEMANSVSTIERMHEKEKRLEEKTRQIEEKERQLEEKARQTEEKARQTEEKARQGIAKMVIKFGNKFSLSKKEIVEEIVEELGVTKMEAEFLFNSCKE